MLVATYVLFIVCVVKEVMSLRVFFVMRQSVNLFPYFIMLLLLIIQVKVFLGSMTPDTPLDGVHDQHYC